MGPLGLGQERDVEIAKKAMAFTGVEHLGDRKLEQLSGGEQQRVFIARAICQDPEVILLDEPTAGLSPLYVDMFFEKVTEIHETRGVGIILAEQNATKALEVADRVMVLSLGESFLIEQAENLTTQQLKEGYRI